MSSNIAVSCAGSSASRRRTQVRATSKRTSAASRPMAAVTPAAAGKITRGMPSAWARRQPTGDRSEEHTSELQSHSDLVCRLLLEKKNGADHRAAVGHGPDVERMDEERVLV